MDDRLSARVVVIDDDEALCRRIVGWLTPERYDVATFQALDGGLTHVQNAPPEIVLVDLRLPETQGVEHLQALANAAPRGRILATAAFPEARMVIGAMRAGAADLLEKPLQRASLLEAVERHVRALGYVDRSENAFNRRLGARLRAVRQDRGRTLSQAAQDAGITSAQLSQIELGRSATSTWTLARICGALRCQLRELFDGL